jgi:hypothetical protein
MVNLYICILVDLLEHTVNVLSKLKNSPANHRPSPTHFFGQLEGELLGTLQDRSF